MQKKLWPQGTNAATTSEPQQTTQDFFFDAMLMLLLLESTFVGEREPITPFALVISPFNDAVVVRELPPQLLKVPIGVVVELENREKEVSVVLGIEGSNDSLANRREAVRVGEGRPLPMEPTPLSPLADEQKAAVSDFVSEPQIEGEGGGGLVLNALLLRLGVIKSSVGEGIRSWLKK